MPVGQLPIPANRLLFAPQIKILEARLHFKAKQSYPCLMPIPPSNSRQHIPARPAEGHFCSHTEYRLLTIGPERFLIQTTTRRVPQLESLPPSLESTPSKVIGLRKPRPTNPNESDYANPRKEEIR